MSNILEEYINTALEAFTNANGDIDKFELQLRRKMMSINLPFMAPTQMPTVNSMISPNFDQVINQLDINDPIFKELEDADIENMDDEKIFEIARKMGLMMAPQNTTVSDE